MRVCFACDEPLPGPEAFRIRIGGVAYDERHGARFIQESYDEFRDGSQIKWLCRSCAVEHDVFVDELELDVCRAVEGRTHCNNTFEPACSKQSETVLLIEWGAFTCGDKGPGVTFVSAAKGHIHFNCACDAWRLPLYDIPPAEAP